MMILGGEGGAQMTCHFNLNQNFPDVAVCEDFQLIMSLPAMLFGDKFCVSRKDSIGSNFFLIASGTIRPSAWATTPKIKTTPII